MNDELQLFVLGRPRIHRGGQPLTELVSAKAQALLLYLAFSGKTCSRSALAGLLWGDMPEETARANLRLALTKLRKFVGDHLHIGWQEIAFNPDLPYRLDAADFLRYASQPEKHPVEQLQSALNLYRGDFLDDFSLHQAPEFEAWALVERERLRQIAFKGWSYLASVYRQQGAYSESIEATRQVLALEPWHEEGYQQLMGLLVQSGQRSAALAQYEVCRHVLAEELGIAPSPETVALYEQIKRETGTVDFLLPPLETVPVTLTPSNLPTPLTPLVGRERECAQVAERLLNPECRLLTLVGPGGIGKTRLALAAAASLPHVFADGVLFVPLSGSGGAQTGEATDVLVAGIAAALHYTFTSPRPPRDLLLHYLADKTLLLVLDNLEQWRAAAKWLAELLRHAPGCKLLITSRERLGVAGEWLYEVQGLPFAANEQRAMPLFSPAALFFAQCAQRLQPDFDPAAEMTAMNRICTLVAGSPLAIELASGWVRVLTCAEIVSRLERSLDLLRTADSLPDDRHRSMRAVLDDAWVLLTPEEQNVFARLSVFQGGWAFAAAETIAGATLPLLASLTDKSWLRREPDGRYQIHELLRQYGREKLALRGAESATRQAHSHYYQAFMATKSPLFSDRTHVAVLIEMDAEVDNLRAAWEWLYQQADSGAITHYLPGLWRYYERKGWFAEAASVLAQAVQLPALTSTQQAQWQRWWGEACYQMGRIVECEEHLGQVLLLLGEPLPSTQGAWARQLFRQANHQIIYRLRSVTTGRRTLAERQPLQDASAALSLLGPIMYQSGDGLSSLTTAFWSLNLAEQAGLSPELARSLAGCCITTGSTPLHRLAELYRQLAFNATNQLNDPATTAYVWELIGLYQLGRGQWAEVETMLAQARLLCTNLELRRHEIETLSLLAKLFYFRGQFPLAVQAHREALVISQKQGDPAGEHWSLLGLVECALLAAEPDLDEVLSWLARAEMVQHARSLARADLMRYYGLLARVRMVCEQYELAAAAAQTATSFVPGQGLAGVWTVEGFAGVAETYLGLWERARKGQHLPIVERDLRAAATRACQSLHVFARVFPIGQPRAWLCQGWYEWLAPKPTRAYHAWQRSLHLAEQLAMPYEQGRAHEVLSHHAQDESQREAHSRQATALFSKLGVKLTPF